MKSKITNEQFEWFSVFWGMKVEGLSTDEALKYILVMKPSTEMYAWLLKEVRS
jgi:hypothetical protein